MLKVLITGPESSGKTQLAQTLARRFHCPWVPEFARTYLHALEKDYEEVGIETAEGEGEEEGME